MARFLRRSERIGQTPVGTGYTAQFQFDPADIKAVIDAMQRWPEQIRQRIVRKGLKTWGKGVVATARRHAYSRAKRTKANIIPDTAEIQINIRSYSETVRTALLDAIRRIVTAECQASNCPREPDIEYFEHAPLTDNDAAVTEKVTSAFTGHFGEAVMVPAPKVMGSEDFSDIANGVGAPYCYWLFGGSDPAAFATAFAAGTVASDIPSNHSPRFAPVIQPTLNTGTAALVAAAMAWLGKDGRPT